MDAIELVKAYISDYRKISDDVHVTVPLGILRGVSAEYAKLEQREKRLVDDYEIIRSRNNDLRTENADLKRQVEELRQDPTRQQLGGLIDENRKLKAKLDEARSLLRQAVMFATELEGFHFGDGDVCESEIRGYGSPCMSSVMFGQFKKAVKTLTQEPNHECE